MRKRVAIVGIVSAIVLGGIWIAAQTGAGPDNLALNFIGYTNVAGPHQAIFAFSNHPGTIQISHAEVSRWTPRGWIPLPAPAPPIFFHPTGMGIVIPDTNVVMRTVIQVQLPTLRDRVTIFLKEIIGRSQSGFNGRIYFVTNETVVTQPQILL